MIAEIVKRIITFIKIRCNHLKCGGRIILDLMLK